jgi:hypothetical protein
MEEIKENCCFVDVIDGKVKKKENNGKGNM